MTGWRVWLAFEVRPGITSAADRPAFGRALAASCRGPDGKLDVAELERWIDLLVEYGYLLGSA